ncbi:MAG: hypothetical protein M5U27_12595 [Gaiella sp.]|nr:hypothetical protein [Gaiella sp.]
MAVFTKRNALVGWIVTRIARKRLERRLNELAGNRRRRPRLVIATGLVAAASAAGATIARRSRPGGLWSA